MILITCFLPFYIYQIQLSASKADPHGVIPLIHPTTGQAMSFVANEVKLKGISGKIKNLYIDFVGHKYKKSETFIENFVGPKFRKTETFIENEVLEEFLDDYLYEAVLEKEPGRPFKLYS